MAAKSQETVAQRLIYPLVALASPKKRNVNFHSWLANGKTISVNRQSARMLRMKLTVSPSNK